MTDFLQHYPYFPDDFQRKTRHLSLVQKGAFRELLDEMWLTNQVDGTIPDDPTYCANVLRVTTAEWAELRAVLVEGPRPVLSVKHGKLSSRRLQEELAIAKRKVGIARDGGKASGQSRRGRSRVAGTDDEPTLNPGSTPVQPTLNETATDAELPRPRPREEERETPREGDPAVSPGVGPDWNAVERLLPAVAACQMKSPPDEQILGMLVTQFGEPLVDEVLRCRAPDLRGKGWQYARKILENWKANPNERPSKRTATVADPERRAEVVDRFSKYDRLPGVNIETGGGGPDA